jgi:hypothetical protein
VPISPIGVLLRCRAQCNALGKPLGISLRHIQRGFLLFGSWRHALSPAIIVTTLRSVSMAASTRGGLKG